MDKDKKDFVIKRGVLGMGLPIAFLMSFTVAMEVPGYLFKIQTFNLIRFLFALALYVPIFSAAGYLWGLFVYKFRKK